MVKKSAQKVRRPYGEKLTRAVRVRLPVELDSALRQVRRLFGVSVAHQIRTGIESSLGDMVPKAVAMVRDENTSTSMKLKLMKFLYSVAKANLAQHHPETAKILLRSRATSPTGAARSWTGTPGWSRSTRPRRSLPL